MDYPCKFTAIGKGYKPFPTLQGGGILGFESKYKSGKVCSKKAPFSRGFFLCLLYLLNKSAFSSD
ncbi:hypothetical protein [uncultured Gammaproteobacteria bacterium]|jgi:hypothetical protein|nr:hypothetical protein [uncultured Gammaproteobacteria bacterium]CAC9574017.1 hypothetical protein [uncultured Gammaproteobacteria bacterium]CAC9590597.1 hypothetical protein [uncultured Gammaproteobacteria bacterium]CAC9592193.1 hypothetical protein [uncultured Gammaproteobacteria bacterium]CAC9599367.1 hypothetical protein [uncultured Gammaproteobacteria bacterium]